MDSLKQINNASSSVEIEDSPHYMFVANQFKNSLHKNPSLSNALPAHAMRYQQKQGQIWIYDFRDKLVA